MLLALHVPPFTIYFPPYNLLHLTVAPLHSEVAVSGAVSVAALMLWILRVWCSITRRCVVQYLKRLNEGAVPQGVLQQEYVQLPNFFGKGGGGGGTFTSKHEGVELERKGGTRPCPGMKGSDRIVMVENASDRIIMVDVGGGGSTSSGRQESSGGNGDTASQDVGYQ